MLLFVILDATEDGEQASVKRNISLTGKSGVYEVVI